MVLHLAKCKGDGRKDVRPMKECKWCKQFFRRLDLHERKCKAGPHKQQTQKRGAGVHGPGQQVAVVRPNTRRRVWGKRPPDPAWEQRSTGPHVRPVGRSSLGATSSSSSAALPTAGAPHSGTVARTRWVLKRPAMQDDADARRRRRACPAETARAQAGPGKRPAAAGGAVLAQVDAAEEPKRVCKSKKEFPYVCPYCKQQQKTNNHKYGCFEAPFEVWKKYQEYLWSRKAATEERTFECKHCSLKVNSQRACTIHESACLKRRRRSGLNG